MLQFDPNPLVLEAQARVCTGPTQSRPLGVKPGDPQPQPVLEAILDTLQNAARHPVSAVQMGAFFGAMRLRRAYPAKTGWSAAEGHAFQHYRNRLQTHLPPDVQYIFGYADRCPAESPEEQIVISALKTILCGGHLAYRRTRLMCEAILSDRVRGSLKGAALIGQRMNRESYDEVRGYLHSGFAPECVRVAKVENLTHFGQPYNGSTRYFKPTLFVAALRAALARSSVLHGVDAMPPKWGVTDEQILNALNARTNLSLAEAAERLENPDIGFAYISQREYAPNAYAARDLRAHIGKRPPWSATEKAQQLFTCAGSNHMVIGYYHSGYEVPLLKIARETGFTSAVAIKGEGGQQPFFPALGKTHGQTAQCHQFFTGLSRRSNICPRHRPGRVRLFPRAKPAPQSGQCPGFCGLGHGRAFRGKRPCVRPHRTQRGDDGSPPRFQSRSPRCNSTGAIRNRHGPRPQTPPRISRVIKIPGPATERGDVLSPFSQKALPSYFLPLTSCLLPLASPLLYLGSKG